jgi:hypothetical protein
MLGAVLVAISLSQQVLHYFPNHLDFLGARLRTSVVLDFEEANTSRFQCEMRLLIEQKHAILVAASGCRRPSYTASETKRHTWGCIRHVVLRKIPRSGGIVYGGLTTLVGCHRM